VTSPELVNPLSRPSMVTLPVIEPELVNLLSIPFPVSMTAPAALHLCFAPKTVARAGAVLPLL
jgi:hypothetical protein